MPPRRKPVKAPPAAHAAAAAHPAGPWRSPVPESHNRYLAQPDAEAFTRVLGLYEDKKFQEGLALVDQILAKRPDHGESLCMRGIFLNSLDRKEEGYASVKRGTKNDPGSHIVWHVYALCLRADKRFEEALDCYKKATEIEKDSLNLLNDMAPLAVQLRRYDDYVAVRLSILRTQPRIRRNWLNLAVAQFLARQYPAATRTLVYYEEMLREVPDGDVELGEVLLFHAQVLEEAGELERCLDFLGEKSAQIPDRTAYSVQRARLLLKLGRTESALWAWEVLLGENPESTEYIRAMVQSKGGSCDAKDADARLHAVSILDTLSAQYPRSLSIRRLALSLLPASAPQFRTRAQAYILDALSRGVPSVFADVKALYAEADGEGDEKARIVGEVVEEFRRSLENKGAVVTEDVGDDDSVESPSTYLWTLYFLASHYSHLSQPSAALSTLSLALAHTPSLPELHTLRARILKRAGDSAAAAHAMEDARRLDGQDRFLNSKAAKYRIRNGECEEAEKVVGLFTRKDAPSPFEDLVEMQCLWFIHEEGDAYAANEDWGRALRRYHQMLDIFEDIEHDQYDFHSYCMRKQTVKAYIELLRFEDKLHRHPRFAAAAKSAISIYCRIHDDPSAFSPSAPTPAAVDAEPAAANGASAAVESELAANGDEATEAEKAQSRKDKKKAKEKAKKAEKQAAGADGKKDDKKDAEEAPANNLYKDTDPLGVAQLADAVKDPLAQAQKFLEHLVKVREDDVQTWALAAEVHLRRGKPLQAVQALRTAYALSPSCPLLPSVLVRLHASLSSSTAPAAALALAKEGVATLLGGESVSPAQFVDEQLQRHGARSAEWILQSAEAKRVLGDAEGAKALVGQLTRDEVVEPSLKHLERGQSFLRTLSASPAELDSFRAAAASLFPLARAFKTSDELAALDAKLAMEEGGEPVEGREEA
ncbi:peptide alpha-N-acetyltransferase complex A subunit NAT1 [Rhodotorula paludigena]|uniref:peptide alpha-N-acetyltransferase complex A subunit NAT1 n=1 Tax=Rhodotorula paludigena TaxID=86838 RepID=UPI00317D470F